MTIEVRRHAALAQQFDAVHPLTGSRSLAIDERFRLDATSVVVAAPVSPDRATEVFRYPQGLISGLCTRGDGLPGSGVFFRGGMAEVVNELRCSGGFTGVPVPIEALEVRNTVAASVPDPINTRPIIDRLFPDSVASRIGAQMVNVGSGSTEWPVVTSNVTVGWAATEGGNVADPTPYQTTNRPLKPDHFMGVQMRISRSAMQQAGAALEQTIRRDMNAAMGQEMDRAILQGSGASGQPLGLMTGAATNGINVSDLSAGPTYAALLAEVVAFMSANTITAPNQLQALIRPELFGWLEGQVNGDLHMSEYHRWAWLLAGRMQTDTMPPSITTTSNGLPAPSGDPLETSMLMTMRTGGVAPLFVGLWNNGALDLVRDPYTDAQSGGLRTRRWRTWT